MDRRELRAFVKNFFVVLIWIAAFILSMLLLIGAFILHPLIGSIVVVIYIAAFVAAIMTL